MIFKSNLDHIANPADTFPLQLLMDTYSRLKNLIFEDIPRLPWEGKAHPEMLIKGQIPSFEPEKHFRVLPFDFQDEDKMNEWFEQALCYCILRKRFDKSETDKDVLHLFRLLSIKFRADYPIRGESYQLKQELKVALDHKICSALFQYVERAKPTTRIYQPKNRNGSRSADANKKTLPMRVL